MKSTLLVNRSLYSEYRRVLSKAWNQGERKVEESINDCRDLARFSYLYHPGYFTDDVLENKLLDLADEIFESKTAPPRSTTSGSRRRRVLHVASCLMNTGGHTRFLVNWIKADSDSDHHLVVTTQNGELPNFVTVLKDNSLGGITQMQSGLSECEKARNLRTLSEDMDFVVLHHNPDDLIPILAFSHVGGPPVIFFNHAHFWFCLGPSVADLTVNTLEYYQNISRLYRQPKKVELIRAPYDVDDHPFVSEELSHKRRLEFGIPVGVPLVLTIGHNDYFRPTQGFDFFATLSEILQQSPSAHALVVGPTGREEFAERYRLHPRMRFVGPVLDPIPYYQAADVVLESFPQPSLGAFLEAVGYGGCYPIPAYAHQPNIYRVDLPIIEDMVARTTNVESYIEHAVGVLSDISASRNNRMARQKSYRDYCENHLWHREFERIYSAVQGKEHVPTKLVPHAANIPVDSLLLARNDIRGPFDFIMSRLSRNDMLKVTLQGLRGMDAMGRISIIRELSALIVNRIKGRIGLRFGVKPASKTNDRR